MLRSRSPTCGGVASSILEQWDGCISFSCSSVELGLVRNSTFVVGLASIYRCWTIGCPASEISGTSMFFSRIKSLMSRHWSLLTKLPDREVGFNGRII